jgi:hypothetical protein
MIQKNVVERRCQDTDVSKSLSDFVCYSVIISTLFAISVVIGTVIGTVFATEEFPITIPMVWFTTKDFPITISMVWLCSEVKDGSETCPSRLYSADNDMILAVCIKTVQSFLVFRIARMCLLSYTGEFYQVVANMKHTNSVDHVAKISSDVCSALVKNFNYKELVFGVFGTFSFFQFKDVLNSLLNNLFSSQYPKNMNMADQIFAKHTLTGLTFITFIVTCGILLVSKEGGNRPGKTTYTLFWILTFVYLFASYLYTHTLKSDADYYFYVEFIFAFSYSGIFFSFTPWYIDTDNVNGLVIRATLASVRSTGVFEKGDKLHEKFQIHGQYLRVIHFCIIGGCIRYFVHGVIAVQPFVMMMKM